ncbi:hypothetical protein NQ318_015103 [Aromia moschata]|uniref:Sulfotransferase n=1 Tax=Aromia moschata TaxID=1265417 RepID=A0AAV8Z009_9CUCU|nr:hypothetical protein NQ318_015103 [Aromia moschata]
MIEAGAFFLDGTGFGRAPILNLAARLFADWQQFVRDKTRAWQQMNLDWLYNFTGPTHVIFYEQLVDNVEHTLKTVMEFIEVPMERDLFRCALERKEGIYRRKKRVLAFEPYTLKMREELNSVQERVYEAIYNFASPASR